jgi:hypothetical protein
LRSGAGRLTLGSLIGLSFWAKDTLASEAFIKETATITRTKISELPFYINKSTKIKKREKGKSRAHYMFSVFSFLAKVPKSVLGKIGAGECVPLFLATFWQAHGYIFMNR